MSIGFNSDEDTLNVMRVLVVGIADDPRGPVMAALLAAARPAWKVTCGGIYPLYGHGMGPFENVAAGPLVVAAIARLGLPSPPPSVVFQDGGCADGDLVLYLDHKAAEDCSGPGVPGRPSKDVFRWDSGGAIPADALTLEPFLPAWRKEAAVMAERYDALAAARPWSTDQDPPPGTPLVATTFNYHHHFPRPSPGMWCGRGADGGPQAIFPFSDEVVGFGPLGWEPHPPRLNDLRELVSGRLWTVSSRAYTLAVGPEIGAACDELASVVPADMLRGAFGSLARFSARHMAVAPAMEAVRVVLAKDVDFGWSKADSTAMDSLREWLTKDQRH